MPRDSNDPPPPYAPTEAESNRLYTLRRLERELTRLLEIASAVSPVLILRDGMIPADLVAEGSRDPEIRHFDNRLCSAALDLWLAWEQRLVFRLDTRSPIPHVGRDGLRGTTENRYIHVGDESLRICKIRFERTALFLLETRRLMLARGITSKALGGKSVFNRLPPELLGMIESEVLRERGLPDHDAKQLRRTWGYRTMDAVLETGDYLRCVEVLEGHPETGLAWDEELQHWRCPCTNPHGEQRVHWDIVERMWRCDGPTFSLRRDNCAAYLAIEGAGRAARTAE